MKHYRFQDAIVILITLVVGLIGAATYLLLSPPPLADRYRGWSLDGSPFTSLYCYAHQYPPELVCLGHDGLPVAVQRFERIDNK